MRIKPDQLSRHLCEVPLAPIYLVSGDEPLQSGEAADQIRLAAKQAGFVAREVMTVEANFEWQSLTAEAANFSIFSDQKLIDLRIPGGKPGTEGSKALVQLADNNPQDTLLLISLPKLTASVQKSKWFQALEKAGVFIQVWPLQGHELISWLQRRCQKKDMRLEPDAAKVLASRIEGNLLAAAQEIEKLYILHGGQTITRQLIEDAVSDSARFDVFKLTDSLLEGKPKRILKILHGLRAEGIAEPVVLWGISRELRTVYNFQAELKNGARPEQLYSKFQLWDKRKNLVSQAVKRMPSEHLKKLLADCAEIDAMIKGQKAGDSGFALELLCLQFCKV